MVKGQQQRTEKPTTKASVVYIRMEPVRPATCKKSGYLEEFFSQSGKAGTKNGGRLIEPVSREAARGLTCHRRLPRRILFPLSSRQETMLPSPHIHASC